jgi:hypothetical protein
VLYGGLGFGIRDRSTKRSECRIEAEIRILGSAGSDGTVLLLNGRRREVLSLQVSAGTGRALIGRTPVSAPFLIVLDTV